MLVTFNRLEDLKKTVEAYNRQTIFPDRMIIVNNASTDGTTAYLDFLKSTHGFKFPVDIIHLNQNLGGAGGFALGMQQAMKSQCDYLFLADDDAVPFQDMFAEFLEFEKDDTDDIAAYCTSVIDQYGFSTVQRGKLDKGLFTLRRIDVTREEAQQKSFEVDYLTFVGAFFKRNVVESVGYPLSEYFIHEDDAEYSTRIRKTGKIICISSSKIYHPRAEGNAKNWIEFYTTRNRIDHVRRHYPKRYYYYTIIDRYVKKCSLLAYFLRGRSLEYRKMNLIAIKEAMNGTLGLHATYKPGVEVK